MLLNLIIEVEAWCREDEAAIQLADGTRFLSQVRAACRGSTAVKDTHTAVNQPVKHRKRPARAGKAGTAGGGKVRQLPRDIP